MVELLFCLTLFVICLFDYPMWIAKKESEREDKLLRKKINEELDKR